MRRRGVTVVEIIVVVALCSLVAASLYMGLATGRKGADKGLSHLDQLGQVNRLLEHLKRALRLAVRVDKAVSDSGIRRYTVAYVDAVDASGQRRTEGELQVFVKDTGADTRVIVRQDGRRMTYLLRDTDFSFALERNLATVTLAPTRGTRSAVALSVVAPFLQGPAAVSGFGPEAYAEDDASSFGGLESLGTPVGPLAALPPPDGASEAALPPAGPEAGPEAAPDATAESSHAAPAPESLAHGFPGRHTLDATLRTASAGHARPVPRTEALGATPPGGGIKTVRATSGALTAAPPPGGAATNRMQALGATPTANRPAAATAPVSVRRRRDTVRGLGTPPAPSAGLMSASAASSAPTARQGRLDLDSWQAAGQSASPPPPEPRQRLAAPTRQRVAPRGPAVPLGAQGEAVDLTPDSGGSLDSPF